MKEVLENKELINKLNSDISEDFMVFSEREANDERQEDGKEEDAGD